MFSFLTALYFMVLLALIAYFVFQVDHTSKGKAAESISGEDLTMVCPRCGSTDIVLDTTTYKAAAEFGGKLYYKCLRCGLIQPTFPLMTREEAERYDKEINKL